MVIDYSKWDNLKLSSDEEGSDDDKEEGTAPNNCGLSQGGSRIAPGTETPSVAVATPGWSGFTKEQLDHIPRIVLLVRSTHRDSILQQMTQNGVEHAHPFGPFGISLLSGYYLNAQSFCRFFPGIGNDQLKKIQAALMRVTVDQYERVVGHRPDFQGGMGGIPYDAQFRGDPLSDGCSTLHVRHGQERQGLYRRVAGPEFKVCKMGSSCGGPVVLVQAEMKASFNGGEDYILKNIDVVENDIPQVVAELLKPEFGVEY